MNNIAEAISDQITIEVSQFNQQFEHTVYVINGHFQLHGITTDLKTFCSIKVSSIAKQLISFTEKNLHRWSVRDVRNIVKVPHPHSSVSRMVFVVELEFLFSDDSEYTTTLLIEPKRDPNQDDNFTTTLIDVTW